MPRIRRMLVLAADGAQSLDVLGPVEVFCSAERLVPGSPMSIGVVAPTEDGEITLSNGLRLGAAPLPDPIPAPRHAACRRGRAHGGRPASSRRGVGGARVRTGPRTASVCTGPTCSPQPACSTGGGRRPTGLLRRTWPSAIRRRRRSRPVFVRDGDVWTSAGVTAGMDLALALVDDDLGPDIALARRPPARDLPQAARRPVAVQRRARQPSRRPSPHCASCRPGSPGT